MYLFVESPVTNNITGRILLLTSSIMSITDNQPLNVDQCIGFFL